MSSLTWKEKLRGELPPLWAQEIDDFEILMHLRKQGKVEEKVFAEARLRRGAYGQRYDNGKRHDGFQTRALAYQSLTKGPDTYYDAPGMQHIKIPYGGLNPEQMRLIADLAEEYSDNICHITTRQDIQLHYVHIEDTPEIFRRLASVGITTREACGNSVRNVTACPLAGVCHTEIFDVTPYAKAVAYYLLGHRDTQDFGRKFKIAFSGCEDEACALVSLHDLGGIAKVRAGADGKPRRGFAIYVGGGLGAVPHQAKLFDEFVPEEELLPLARAIGRVFARLGEKKNRNRARLKFVVQKLGIDEFKRLVLDEVRTMPDDPSWRTFFDEIPRFVDRPAFKTVPLRIRKDLPEGYARWEDTNVYRQRQAGYATVTITCPMGDLTSRQMRAIADLAEKFAGDSIRTTVEQNLVLRWVPEDRVVELYEALVPLGLGASGAGSIVDVTACPGSDTCKLGIASSRGLARELRERLAAQSATMDQAIKSLRIKISGCFNSCGQHHMADIGFYGNSRNIGKYTVPHFQVMLGGQWRHNGGAYALAMGSVPSKRIPELVNALTARYVAEKTDSEDFQAWCQRVGKKSLKETVDQFDVRKIPAPAHEQDPDFYTDWGDVRAFTIGDMAAGECAGELVSPAQFGFMHAETEAFEAQVLLDDKRYNEADYKAYHAMLNAAKALVQLEWLDVPDDPNTIIEEFRKRFVESKLFWDTYHGDQFSRYLFARHEGADTRYTTDTVHKLVEETNLFIDAAHKAHMRWQEKQVAASAHPAASLQPVGVA